MPNKHSDVTGKSRQIRFGILTLCAAILGLPALVFAAPGAVTLNVVEKMPDGSYSAIAPGYRWVLEEDATNPVDDIIPVAETHALNFHRSYMPVIASGASGDAIVVPDSDKKYYISVLPNSDYQMSGRQVVLNGAATGNVTVVVNAQPVPTAQIFMRAFEDTAPLNNTWDTGEAGLGGFTVFIYDVAGVALTDACGQPLGTVYPGDLCDEGTMIRGDGTILTMTAANVDDPIKNPYGLGVGEALVKNIAPGKYGMRVVPAYGEGWQQTATIEGTPGLDVWVKSNEPRYFAEFGPAGHHAEFGFVREFSNLDGGSTVTGVVKNLRMARPPEYTFANGDGLANCWVGLNDELGTQALFAAPCDNANGDGSFTIPNVPDGTYQLVIFDSYLLQIFTARTVVVNGDTNMGDVPAFRWFGTQEHIVFMDDDGDGIRDPGEAGIPDAGIVLHYRDGSVYAANATDIVGEMPFEEIFPFFSWLVAESDYARPLKPTGATFTTDAGGPSEDGVAGNNDPDGLVDGDINPQIQDPNGAFEDGGDGTTCDSAGNCLTRTELGPVLTQGYNQVLGSTTRMEWGRQPWGPGENGGIGGIVHYATTRAENNPQFAAWEDWEPGIPRVQVNVYRGTNTGAIYHRNPNNGNQGGLHVPGTEHLSDVDNYPYCWSDQEFVDANPAVCAGPGFTMGVEDINNNNIGPQGAITWHQGDAIEVAHTDSFDDSQPGNCPGNPTDPFHDGDPSNGGLAYDPNAATAFDGKCYDGLRNFNQTRPAVFDGGFGLGAPFSDQPLDPGFYVVEANTPPGYEHVKEEDKNVDFGDEFTVNLLALPPACVGPDHLVPAELDLFPGVPTASGGEMKPMCDRKVVQVSDGKNAALDFFMFTKVPVGGHIQGFVLNDLANEFDPANVNFGEKFAPSYIPVSVRDWAGNEVYHTTSDRYGTYNAIVPSTYTMNVPIAAGVAPNMLQVCLNSPMMDDPANPGTYIPDPHFNKQYTQFCYTLNFQPGQTTYLDTPVLPIAAYTGANNYQLDSEFPDGTPRIFSASVDGNGSGGGPLVTAAGQTINIVSMGDVQVPDPTDLRLDGGNGRLITRDYGFGDTAGSVSIGGVALTGVVWTNDVITATVPASVSASGQLSITRSAVDGGQSSVTAVTVIVDTSGPVINTVGPGGTHATIQAAVNATPAGGIVLVSPNLYLESVIVTKPIQLQGWGEGTIINATQSPSDKLAKWRETINTLANCSNEIGLLPGQGNNLPGPNGAAPFCGFTPGTGLFTNDEAAGILVAPRNTGVNQFNGSRVARVDGFTIAGADQSGGIVVNGYADFLEVSNNRVENNQSTVGAAGIRIGQPSLLDGEAWTDSDNDYVNVHNNHVNQNGSLFEPGGGIGIYTGSDNYRVTGNWVSGNFALGDGAGIAHYGSSDNGLIADNVFAFNQTFDQTALTGGSGGGIMIAGHAPLAGGESLLTAGAGSAGSNVKVLRNLIQGNNAGSGSGGGIMLRQVNGADRQAVATDGEAFGVDIVGNLIVNNIAGMAGGGIALQDAVNVQIINNTVANNDSTATAAAAFGNFDACLGGTTVCQSNPQPAGIVSFAHSANYATLIGAGYSDPTLTNDIVIGNRSWYWTGAPAGSTGFTSGALLTATDEFQDFAAPGAAQLTISNSVIATDADVTGANNVPVSDNNQDNFVNSYRNRGPNTTFIPGGEFPILAGVAADEGGNFIDVHFGPLSLYNVEPSATLPDTSTWVRSDYHLVDTAVAIDAGAVPNHPNQGLDIDRDGRPAGPVAATAEFDIGADEYFGPGYEVGAGSNSAPTILSPTQNQEFLAYFDVDNVVQISAIDPNNDALSYAKVSVVNKSSGFPGGLGMPSNSALLAALSVDASTGVVTYTGLRRSFFQDSPYFVTFRVSVSDGVAAPVTRDFRFNVIPELSSTAVGDTIDVTTMGTFAVAAPGILGNDINPSTEELVVCNLNPAPGNFNCGPLAPIVSPDGTVVVQTNGAVNFSPASSTWVGQTSFSYRSSNNSGLIGTGVSLFPANVTISRRAAVTSADYDAGTWTISGSGFNGDRIYVEIDGFGLLPINPGPDFTTVSGGSWTFVSNAGPAATPGTTITVIAQDNVGGGVFEEVGSITDFPVTLAGALPSIPRGSAAYVQCPHDDNGNGRPDPGEGSINGDLNWSKAGSNVVCKHLAAGDGFSVMADGRELYGFSFNDVTDELATDAIDAGMLNAHFPAPTMVFNQGEEAFVTLTNVGMLKRPDLFDPHTIHFHGFPNAASVFDGVPDSSVSINMGFSLTYYYSIQEPGTFMYHCHVEAAEHMQMGMLGNLYVKPAQNTLANGSNFGGYTQFVYNDGDGTTGYDVEYPIQIGSFDSDFHQASFDVQPLPFAEMDDDYSLLNGRGYPDTANTAPVPVGPEKSGSAVLNNNESSQVEHSLITASPGQRVLLRISNLNVTRYNTLSIAGLPMTVVGTGAHILRGPNGEDQYYETSSVTLGGGEAVDVMVDIPGDAAVGSKYVLYSTNLNQLSNGPEDFGGMMTEILITTAP